MRTAPAWVVFGILLSLPSPAHAGAGVWTSNGPFGGQIASLAIAPTNHAIVFAGTDEGGLFRSTDAGATWSGTNLIPGNPRSLTVHPTDSSIVYAGGTFGGGFRSGVYKSTDAGRTWRVGYLSPPAPATQVQLLALDASNPSTLYAGTFDAGLHKSTDGGATWTPINAGLPDTYMAALAIDPATPTTLYTSTFITHGLYKSTDAGQTWGSALMSGVDIEALAFDPVASGTVYAAGSGQVFKSTDAGGSWLAVLPASSGAGEALAVDPQSPTTVYAGTEGGGVLKSTNGGATWAAANQGLTSLHVGQLVIDATAPATVYAGTPDGVFKSTNGGGTWLASNRGLVAIDVEGLAIDWVNPTQIYVAANGHGIFKSTNSGDSWVASNAGLTNLDLLALATDASTPGTLYVAAWGGAVYRSTDAAASWSLRGVVPSSRVVRLVVDPLQATTLYATTESVEGSGGRIYKSTDAAASWVASGPFALEATGLLIDPWVPSTVYASAVDGVYKTTNAGGTWSPMNSGFPYAYVSALAAPATGSGTVYAATQFRGVYKTTNGGLSWLAVNTGLPPNARVLDVAVLPSNPDTVYAAAVGGVYRSTNAGGTWARVNSGLPGWPMVRALALPRTGPAVFAAPEHGSVWQASPPPRSFVKGDLDGDALPDLVFQNGAQLKLWLMDGVVRASEAAVSPEPSSADWLVRGVDDFDADGGNDLVLWSQLTGQVEFWLMNGPTRLGAPVPLAGGPVLPTNWELSATGDLNGDGMPDLVWRNSTSQKIVVWTMHLTTKIGAIVPTPGQAVDANWSIVAARDFNNDGFADFLWYNSTSGKIVTWYLQVSGFLSDSIARTTGQFTTPANAGDNNWKVVASADFSGAAGPGTPPLGSPDIVWRNETSGNQVVWHMDFASRRVRGEFTSPAANTPALDWTIVGPR